MINIVTGDTRPIFKQIVDGIRLKIASGELVEGNKLPSVRGLALQLMINSNTVNKAYGELITLGLVESRQGLGFFVCPPRQLLSHKERQRRLDQAVDTFVIQTTGLDFSNDELLTAVSEKLPVKNLKKRTGSD